MKAIWKSALSKSRDSFERLNDVFKKSEITHATWEEIEELLIRADVGVKTTNYIIGELQQDCKAAGITRVSELQILLKKELTNLIQFPKELVFSEKLNIILLVGVNGSGKTTTIAKLGKYFKTKNCKVLLVGADTFRAAATDQLAIWAKRLDIPIITGQPGSDSGAVVFDGIQHAISKDYDLVLVDTAGRLHNRFNLMDELRKIYRVAGKALPDAPHATWLVLDAPTGQNAITQARAFKDAVNISGIILAKLDSSAKGGMVFAIQHELNVPILFAGLGESADDFTVFDPDSFVNGLLGE